MCHWRSTRQLLVFSAASLRTVARTIDPGYHLERGYADFALCQDHRAVHLPSRKMGRGSLEIKVVVRACAVWSAQFPVVESGPGFGVSPPNYLYLVALPDSDGISFDREQMCQTIDSVGKNPNRGFSELDVFKRCSRIHPCFARERPRWYGACVLLAIQSALAPHSMRWRWLA